MVGGGSPARRSPNRTGRPPVHRPEGGIEAPDAGKSRREGDGRHRHRRLVHQGLRALHAPCGGHGARGGPSVPREQPAQMPSRHAEHFREVLDRLAVVEESSLDEPQRPRHGRPGAAPGRRSGRGLGATAETGSEARALRGGRSREEDHVGRFGWLHGAGGSAIDAGGQHPGVEPPVEAPVSRDPRAITRVPVEGEPSLCHGSQPSTRCRPRLSAATMASGNGETTCTPTASVMGTMRARYFYGWNVVGATFGMALFSFGLGFYGLSVYVAMLQRVHGWSAAAVSAPITAYYVAGALLTVAIGSLYERFGPRTVVAGGGVAMAAGVAALGLVARPWQLYPAFLVMSLGWGALSGAAINIILAPWFVRRRGFAVSLAFTGATLGGVIVAPALIPLIATLGFRRALATAALVLAMALLALPLGVMRRAPGPLARGPDRDPRRFTPDPPASGQPGGRGAALRTWRFWSVSVPFALGLAAQVGVLTHLVALVTPGLGTGGAARAVSATTAAAVLGRLVTGLVVDRLNRRLVASATLAIQMAGLAALARAPSPMAVYAGCALFGLGVGNLTTLPGLTLAVEW